MNRLGGIVMFIPAILPYFLHIVIMGVGIALKSQKCEYICQWKKSGITQNKSGLIVMLKVNSMKYFSEL